MLDSRAVSASQMASCDINGVLGPAVAIIASWQAIEAIKLLSGNASLIQSAVISFDFGATKLAK